MIFFLLVCLGIFVGTAWSRSLPTSAPTRFSLYNLPVDYDYDEDVDGCIAALKALPRALVGIAASSSSDTSMLAESSDPAGFAADIGNYDMCMRQRGKLVHCLAGSIKLGDPFIALPPHSGICVPEACGPKELQSRRLHAFLQHELSQAVFSSASAPRPDDDEGGASASSSSPGAGAGAGAGGKVNQVAPPPAPSSAASSSSFLLSQRGQQRFIYYVKLDSTVRLTAQTNTTYTCGAHNASMTFDRYLFFFAFAVLLLIVLGSTVFQMSAPATLSSAGRSHRSKVRSSASSATPPQARGGPSPEQLSKWLSAVVNAFSLINTVPFIFDSRPSPAPASASSSSSSSAAGAGAGAGAGAAEKDGVDRFIALDGLRALSILWIILGHTLTVSTSIGLLNPAAVLPPEGFLKHTSAQLLLSSRFAVDTFFFISGFLVVLSLLKRLMGTVPGSTSASGPGSGSGLGAGAEAGAVEGTGTGRAVSLSGLSSALGLPSSSAPASFSSSASASASGSESEDGGSESENRAGFSKSNSSSGGSGGGGGGRMQGRGPIMLSYGNRDFEMSPVSVPLSSSSWPQPASLLAAPASASASGTGAGTGARASASTPLFAGSASSSSPFAFSSSSVAAAALSYLGYSPPSSSSSSSSSSSGAGAGAGVGGYQAISSNDASASFAPAPASAPAFVSEEGSAQAGAGEGDDEMKPFAASRGWGWSTAVVPIPPLSSWLPAFYVHRLLRIWPPYVFCLLVWWKIGVLLGNGPFWYRWLSFTHRCDMYFWTNLAFVNNLVPYDISESDECFYISWYLADDMQFYLVSPLFVCLYLLRDWLGIFSCIAAVAASSFIGFAGTIKHGWSAHSFDGLNVTKYSHAFYTKPQYRLSSYAVGMLAAMLWHQKCRRFPSFSLSPALAQGLMITAIAVIFGLTFGGVSAYQSRPCGYYEPFGPQCGSNWPIEALAAYNAFSKPLWALAVATIVLLSGNQQGGAVQAFLSHAVWAPPAKLSFAVYLLHVILINIWMLGRTQKLRYSHFDFAMDYCAVVFVSFAAGLVVAVVIESPSARLSSLIERSYSEWAAGISRSGSGSGKGSASRAGEKRGAP